MHVPVRIPVCAPVRMPVHIQYNRNAKNSLLLSFFSSFYPPSSFFILPCYPSHHLLVPPPGPPFFPPPTLSISGFCRKGTVRHMGQSPHSRSHLLIHSMWKGCPHGTRRVAMPLGLVYLRNEWQIEHFSFSRSSCRSLTCRSIIARAAVSSVWRWRRWNPGRRCWWRWRP